VTIGERRKDPRRQLSMPVRVQGTDSDGSPWEEMTTCEDVSSGGCAFNLRHPVLTGQVLFLSLPLPKDYRRYALADPSYKSYALVRGLAMAGVGVGRISVMFLGKNPPKGYEENPGGRYLLATDPKPAPKERRQFRRIEVVLALRLRRYDAASGTLQEEQTLTENLSRGGARVQTGMAVSKGEILFVEDPRGAYSARAQIQNLFIGKDGIPRLNLRFLNGGAPDRLIQAAGFTEADS
jgi:PilZ domain-containing protein